MNQIQTFDPKLKEYLENVIELEKNAYIQNRTLQALQTKINQLGRPKNIRLPEKQNTHAGTLAAFIGLAFSALPAGAIIGGFIGIVVDSVGFFSAILWGAVIGFVACLLIGVITKIVELSNDNSANRKAEEKWEDAVASDAHRVYVEEQQASNLKVLQTQLIAKRNETRNLLNHYYQAGPIFPKYHNNMIAMCSFYEYFLSGRCKEFTGHEGAYNLFENELRLNVIIGKLDVIIKKLDQIRTAQHMLYLAISESNKKLDRLINESARQSRLMEFNAEQNAITAYNTEQIRIETRQLRWLKEYEMVRNS